MFSFLYNCSLILFAVLLLPKLLWQRCVHGKYRGSFAARLGISLPAFFPKKGQEVIWIHAVSMGETRAIIPFFKKLKATYPQAAIVISSTTQTGHAEAKQSMPEADAHFYLPLDFSWAMRRILDRIQPTKLILCESDFWYHLLKRAKERSASVHLINGKVSERSCQKFCKLRFFTRKLFAHFDDFCIQSERYRDRFIRMGIPSKKIFITGSLKFDTSTKKMEIAELKTLKEFFHISSSDRVLVIGSTHAPEEEALLSSLVTIWKKWPNLKVLLAPRHPERFNEVAHLIQEKGIGFCRLSDKKKENTRLILIDAMGKLNQCYQIADIALVGGSFTSRIGGHNILEPIAFGVPVFFGPHMHNQPDLEEIVLTSKAGKQVTIENLPEALIKIFEDKNTYQQLVETCHQLTASLKGATERTFSHIFTLEKENVPLQNSQFLKKAIEL